MKSGRSSALKVGGQVPKQMIDQRLPQIGRELRRAQRRCSHALPLATPRYTARIVGGRHVVRVAKHGDIAIDSASLAQSGDQIGEIRAQ